MMEETRRDALFKATLKGLEKSGPQHREDRP